MGGNSEAALRRTARFASGWAASLEMVALGVNSVILHLHSFDWRTQLRRLEREVLPKI